MSTIQVRALTCRAGIDRPTVEVLQLRSPGPGEIMLRMTAAGICHSDLHAINGDWPADTALVLGHEGAGIVEVVGHEVDDLKPGDTVSLNWLTPCGTCQACAADRPWLCEASPSAQNLLPGGTTPFTDGHGEPVRPFLGVGAFADRVVVARSAVVAVPAAVPPAVAALIGCAVTTGIGAVTNTARVEPGSSAVVIGCGGVGQAIVMGLAAAGASTVLAVDTKADRLRLAKSLGATDALDAGAVPDPVSAAREVVRNGFDYAFDAIGAPAVSRRLPEYLAAGGTAVLVGMPSIEASVDWHPFDLVGRGLTIMGSNYGSSRPQVDFVRLADAYLAGELPLDDLVGERIGLDQVPDALAGLTAATGARTVVVWD